VPNSRYEIGDKDGRRKELVVTRENLAVASEFPIDIKSGEYIVS